MAAVTGTAARARSLSPAWAVIMWQELRDLWMTARGPGLVLTFSLLLSAITFLAAENKELNLIDQRDTVNLVLQLTLGIGVVLALLFSADAISGERERETIETLLLTPIRPRDIALGKVLATLTVWPVVMLVSVPYVWALRVGSSLSIDALLATLVVGSMLTVAFASLGTIVSTFSNSNRLSLGVTLFIFIVLMAPTQLPVSGWLADAMFKVNPVTAGSRFLDRIIVKDHSWGSEMTYLVAPAVAFIVTSALATVAASRIRLEGGLRR